jgi:hypothetical protein
MGARDFLAAICSLIISRATQPTQSVPGDSIEELVYGARGLAVLVARRADGAADVIRLRGFAAMSADAYLDDYVRLHPEPL